MPNLVNAYVIYNGTNGEYVGDRGIQISINCERLQAYSPRQVWLKRTPAPGDGTIILYEPTFTPSSDEILDPNIVPGFWIEQDNQDTMVDVTTVAAFQQACDACCGAVPTIIANVYNGNVTAYSQATLNFLCIYRNDTGSAGDHDAFAADYAGKFVGTAVMRSNFSNTSHYTIQSYYTYSNFPLLGTDTIYTGACAS